MTETTFANALMELLARLDSVLAVLRQDGGTADLLSLQQQLTDLMGLAERDPGLEAATGDLYAAAEALVADRALALRSAPRKQRMLIDAHERFRDRLASARPLKPGGKRPWLHPSLRFAA